MERTIRGILAVFLASIVACEGASQPSGGAADEAHVVVAGPPSCDSCRIELREVATLGSSEDPASVRPDGTTRGCLVARDGAGGFLMSGPVGGGQVFRYSTDGKWLGSLGRAGEGPGEFGRNLAVFLGSADSIYVADNSQYRVSLLDPEGEFIRSFKIPGQAVASAVLTAGELLFHFRPSGLPADERSLFYLMDPSGAQLARFGTSARADPESDQWTVGAHPNGGFWAGSVWEYELYRWESPDSLVQTVTRQVDWFPSGVELTPETYAEMYVSKPPPPQLMNIVMDDLGLVWTYSWVPDRNWAPNEIQQPRPEWTRANFDTMIEVLDVKAGVVLAAARSDEMLGHACNDNLAYAVVETETGDTRVLVLEPRLLARE